MGRNTAKRFFGLGMFTVDGPEPAAEAAPALRKSARPHPLDRVTLGKGADWTRPDGFWLDVGMDHGDCAPSE